MYDVQILLRQQYFEIELAGKRPVIGVRFPRVPARNKILKDVHPSFWRQLKEQWVDKGKDVIIYLDNDDSMDEIENLYPRLSAAWERLAGNRWRLPGKGTWPAGEEGGFGRSGRIVPH